MTPLLRVSGVGIIGRLQPTDVQLGRGTVTALIGPNGGGKTSLLRALAGIDRPSGTVRIGEERLASAGPSRRRQLLSFLPAGRNIVWPIAARDLIALGLGRADPARVDELLAQLELTQLADRPADRLSTGERARVLIGRALAPRPAVLLLDEPLSNLDPYWSLRTSAILRAAAQAGAAVLVALHDLSLLSEFDRAMLIADGRLIADGPPGEVLVDPMFEQAFRVRSSSTGWRISPSAGPRSSP